MPNELFYYEKGHLVSAATVTKRAPNRVPLRKLIATPVTATVGGLNAAEARADLSRVNVRCEMCDQQTAASAFTLTNDAEQMFGTCRSCGRTGMIEGHRLVAVPDRQKALAATVAVNKRAVSELQAARAALRGEMGAEFLLNEDASMNPVELVQKRHADGLPLTPADVARGLEARADMHFARNGALTIEKAKDLAYSERLFPFRAPGPDNPTWAELERATKGAPSPIRKAARESEAEALAIIEKLAERERAKNPRLTKEAAISVALGKPEGAKAYDAYSRAQRLQGAQ